MVTTFPLLYGIRRAISGKGFLAGVDIKGRALLEFEDGLWWAVGVQPAGVTASGDTTEAASAAFRNAVTEVLFDSAALQGTFAAFQKDVQNFGKQKNGAAEARWNAARKAVQEGAEPKDGFVATLPRIKNRTPSGVVVVRLDKAVPAKFTPADNKTDTVYLPAA